MSKPSFWVSVLVFGSVNHFKQFQFWIFLHPSPISTPYSSQAHPRTFIVTKDLLLLSIRVVQHQMMAHWLMLHLQPNAMLFADVDPPHWA